MTARTKAGTRQKQTERGYQASTNPEARRHAPPHVVDGQAGRRAAQIGKPLGEEGVAPEVALVDGAHRPARPNPKPHTGGDARDIDPADARCARVDAVEVEEPAGLG